MKNRVIVCLTLALAPTLALAGGLKDLDITNKNSKVRAACRRVDPTVHGDVRHVLVATAVGATVGAIAVGGGAAVVGYSAGQTLGSAIGMTGCNVAGAAIGGASGVKVGAVYGAGAGFFAGLATKRRT